VLTFEPDTIDEAQNELRLRDSSGNNLHGILTGGEFVNGIAGQALLLQGEGYVTIPNHTLLQGGADATVTVAAWCRIPPGMAGGHLVGKCWDGFSKDWHCEADLDRFLYASERSGRDYNLIAHRHLGNRWNHVAFVLDRPRTVLRLYVNGQVIEENLNLGDVSVATRADVYIGRRYYDGDGAEARSRFAGVIDELIIYNRALADSEVRALYQHGAAGHVLRTRRN
jgi:hypothetical protein